MQDSPTQETDCMYLVAKMLDGTTGETVLRLSLGRRLVNLLPVAQRTHAFTNGVVDRPWVVGREFEPHVHHENAFKEK